MQELRTLADLLTRPDFLAGAILGAACVFLMFLLPTSARLWGVSVTAATTIGINLVIGRRFGMTVGIVLVAVGGYVMLRSADKGHRLTMRLNPLGLVLVLAGSLMSATRGDLDPGGWLPWVLPPLVLIAGLSMSGWSVIPPSLLGPMFFISAFGIWTTVPETDSPRVLLGVAALLAAATLPSIGARLTSAGAFGIAGLVAWIGATAGDTRPASIIGAWGSLGFVVLYPILYERIRVLPPWLVVGAHSVFVLVSARAIGLRHAAGPAAITLIAMTGIVIALSRVRWRTDTAESTVSDPD